MGHDETPSQPIASLSGARGGETFGRDRAADPLIQTLKNDVSVVGTCEENTCSSSRFACHPRTALIKVLLSST